MFVTSYPGSGGCCSLTNKPRLSRKEQRGRSSPLQTRESGAPGCRAVQVTPLQGCNRRPLWPPAPPLGSNPPCHQSAPARSGPSVDNQVVSMQGHSLQGRGQTGWLRGVCFNNRSRCHSLPLCRLLLYLVIRPLKPLGGAGRRSSDPPVLNVFTLKCKPPGPNADHRPSLMQEILHREPLYYLKPPFIFTAVMLNPCSPPELLRIYPSLIIVWLRSAEPSSFPGSEIKISCSDDKSFPHGPSGTDKVFYQTFYIARSSPALKSNKSSGLFAVR